MTDVAVQYVVDGNIYCLSDCMGVGNLVCLKPMGHRGNHGVVWFDIPVEWSCDGAGSPTTT